MSKAAHFPRISFGNDGSDHFRISGSIFAHHLAYSVKAIRRNADRQAGRRQCGHAGILESQLRQPVRFADGLRILAEGKTPAGKNPFYLEVGPGNALTTFVNGTAKESGTKPVCASTLPVADSSRPDTEGDA